MRFLNALYASSCPTLTVLVRKAFGLAYETMNGRKYHTDGLYAWAGAEIGFMDPEIGVNVLYGDARTLSGHARAGNDTIISGPNANSEMENCVPLPLIARPNVNRLPYSLASPRRACALSTSQRPTGVATPKSTWGASTAALQARAVPAAVHSQEHLKSQLVVCFRGVWRIVLCRPAAGQPGGPHTGMDISASNRSTGSGTCLRLPASV